MAQEQYQSPDQYLPSTHEELRNNPNLVADVQLAIGQKWAELYGSSIDDNDTTAEIVLRNPAVYLDRVRMYELPNNIAESWKNGTAAAEVVAKAAATEAIDWAMDTNGFHKIQHLVQTGRVKPEWRGPVAGIMSIGSFLFAESSRVVPGDKNYHAGNSWGMIGWLDNHKRHLGLEN